MSHAVLGVQDFQAGRYDSALNSFGMETADLTVSLMMKLMQAWAQQGAGDAAAARITLSTLPGGSYFSKFGLLQLGELEFGQGNYDAALKALDELKAQDPDTMKLEMVLLRARILDAKGDKAGALKYLEDYSEESGTFETGPIPAYINVLKSGGVLEGPRTPQENAARALTETSFGFFVQARAFDVAEVFLRVATQLDPDYDKARMWTGEILAYNKRDDEALKMLRSVPESSPYWVSAKLSESLFFSTRDRDSEALTVLERLDNKQPSFVTRGALGRAYLIKEDYDKALPFYEAMIASLSEEELKEDPTNLFLRGVAYTETENWDAAKADFQRVLSYNSDHSDALNYLGYTWVDRGENLTEAFEMIRRALELEPNSGAITDSLGWAHYKLGEYEKARLLLEDAVVLSPSSAPPLAISLTKNLPVSAGLGGGSANAAAMLRLLRNFAELAEKDWHAIALSLGADVPVCLLSKTAHMTGIGEGVSHMAGLGRWPAVLVNPGVPTPTGAVFNCFDNMTGVNAPHSTPRPQKPQGDMLARTVDGRNPARRQQAETPDQA